MNDTNALIQQLVAHAHPVRRLASPFRRTLLWFVLALACVGAVVIGCGGLRPGWLQEMRAASAAIEWSASVLTGVLAAHAVFRISVPGRSPAWAWLPLPAALFWLGGIGLGCLRDIANVGPEAFAYQSHGAECARAIVFTSLPMGLVMLLMVRHAGVLRPAATAALAALSAAALSAAGVSLIHSGETALMSLLWHAGTATVLSVLAGLAGRRLFSWLGGPR